MSGDQHIQDGKQTFPRKSADREHSFGGGGGGEEGMTKTGGIFFFFRGEGKVDKSNDVKKNSHLPKWNCKQAAILRGIRPRHGWIKSWGANRCGAPNPTGMHSEICTQEPDLYTGNGILYKFSKKITHP